MCHGMVAERKYREIKGVSCVVTVMRWGEVKITWSGGSGNH